MGIDIDIQVEKWPIARLLPRITNPRTHSADQIAQIAAAMREWGWTNPVLVGEDGDLIAGYGRLLAARQLNLPEVPVIVLRHLTAGQRRALVIADNQLALNAGWDLEMLRLELAGLQEESFPVDLLGFDPQGLAELLAAEQDATGLTDEDAVPEIPRTLVNQPGDLWLLGPHRLLCGDALVAADVARLLADGAAHMIFTDPPYCVGYEGRTSEHLQLAGDRMSPEQYAQFLATMAHSLRSALQPAASLYLCHASRWQRECQNALEESGLEIRCQIIWAKSSFAWGYGRYKFQHEPLFYAHLCGSRDVWYGDKSQSTLWEEHKPAANRLHPTMKPVELVERALTNSSQSGERVADLFGGAGSTLIACERLGRKARLMEIDPRYADVICIRWEQYTGQAAVRASDGQSFAAVAQQRCQEAA